MRIFYFTYFANLGVVVPYFPLYYESLGLTPFEIGVLVSIMPLVRPFAAGAWSLPADRLGMRHAATVLTCWLAAAAFALYLIPTSFAGLALVTILVASAHAPTLSLGEATVLEATRSRNVPYGHVRVWGSFGFILSAWAFGAVLGRVPLRAALWAALLFAVLMGFSSHALPRPPAPAPRARTSLRGFLSRRGVLAFYVSSTLMQASHAAYYTFFSIHMAAQGHSGAVIGALWALAVVAEVAVMYASPRLPALAVPSSLLTSCFLLAAARWGLLAVSSSLWIAVPAQLLHAFTFAAFHLAAVTATHRIFPEDLRASGQAVYSGLTYGVGTVAGSLVAGWLFGVIGAFRLFAVSALIALAGALLIGRATRGIADLDAPAAGPVAAR